MLRRCISAAVVLFVLGGFVIAGTYQAVITSLDKDEVKAKVFKGKKDKKGTEKTFKFGKDVKFTQKGKDDDEAKVLKADEATKLVEKAVEKSKRKGARATIKTEGEGDDEKVTEITFSKGRGK